MSTDEKCRAIVFAIRDLVADEAAGPSITFSPARRGHNWGKNSATVEIAGHGHTHVGDPDDTDDQFVDSLYALLCQGQGLSFAKRGAR